MLNWASKSRDERGKLFLASNPLRGLKAPTENNPNRQQVHRERRKSNARCYPIRRIPVHFHVDAMLCPDAAIGANNPQVRSRSKSANRQSLIVILAFSASGFGARFAFTGRHGWLLGKF